MNEGASPSLFAVCTASRRAIRKKGNWRAILFLIDEMTPNLALQRARSAAGPSSPRAEEEYARASLGENRFGAAERRR